MFAGTRRPEDRGIDFRAQDFGSQCTFPTTKFFPPPGLEAASTSIARAKPFSVIESARRISFSSSSVFASRSGQKSRSVVRRRILHAANSCAKPSGKLAGNKRGADAAFPQKVRQDLFVRRALSSLPLHFAFELRCRKQFVRLGLFSRAIDLQIAQDQRPFPFFFEKNKRVRRENRVA